MEWNKDRFIKNIEYLKDTHCRGSAKEFNNRIGQRDAYTRWRTSDIKPNLEAILKICNIFECSCDWLLGGEAEQPPTAPTEPVNETAQSYTSGVDLGASPADLPYFMMLKTILESDDDVTKEALKANLTAFAESVRREGEIKENLERINDLGSRLANIERALNASGHLSGPGGEEAGPEGRGLKKAM